MNICTVMHKIFYYLLCAIGNDKRINNVYDIMQSKGMFVRNFGGKGLLVGFKLCFSANS